MGEKENQEKGRQGAMGLGPRFEELNIKQQMRHKQDRGKRKTRIPKENV